MPSLTSTWAAISWMWCGTDGECPAQRRKGLFIQSLPCLCAHPPSLLPSHLFNKYLLTTIERWDSQVALVVKNLPANAGDIRDCGFDPWVGKIPWRRGHSNSLKYSCLENPMDSEVWRASVHRVTQSQILLNTVVLMTASSGARLGAFRDQIYHFRHIPFLHPIQKAGKIKIILLDYMMIKRDYVYKWLRVQCLHLCACLLIHSVMSNSWRLHGL